MTEDDNQLSRKANEALDARARGLDGATLSRLHQARVKAVEQGRRRLFGLPLLPAGGLAAAAVVLLAVVLWGPLGPLQQEPGDYQPPHQSIAQGDELELLEELDFYKWLADSRA